MVVQRTLKILILGYAKLISPLMGPKCRFYPTCSSYAVQAIDRHGSLKGCVMALKRLLCCHPYYKGPMQDEVPHRIDWGTIIGYKRAIAKNHTGCGCSAHKTEKDKNNATT